MTNRILESKMNSDRKIKNYRPEPNRYVSTKTRTIKLGSAIHAWRSCYTAFVQGLAKAPSVSWERFPRLIRGFRKHTYKLLSVCNVFLMRPPSCLISSPFLPTVLLYKACSVLLIYIFSTNFECTSEGLSRKALGSRDLIFQLRAVGLVDKGG